MLLTACLLVFANNFDHDYHLDSVYGIEGNPAVRDLANVPSFFSDPTTLTTLRQNHDYRPVLQTSFAINHAISGYQTWSWHLLQILLHFTCVLGLYSLSSKVLEQFFSQKGGWRSSHLPLVAALIFAVHPCHSGVVNYLWARSSLLVGALILPAIVCYMRPRGTAVHDRVPWCSLLLFTVALWTKVEAVAVLGVFFLYEVVQIAEQRRVVGARASFLGDVRRALLSPATRRRLLPFVLIALGYFLLRSTIVGDYVAAARQEPDTTAWGYLGTQLTAWWHYIGHWFAPVGLIADDTGYPEYAGFMEAPVLYALAAWALVAAVLVSLYSSRPGYMFLVVSALALISPHSSFLPLAEMVNEHRPYIPLAVLSLAWLIPARNGAALLARGRPITRCLIGGASVLLLGAFAQLTWERNKVFATWEGYWQDVVEKAPSARAWLNLGIGLKGREGDDPVVRAQARACFEQSLEFRDWHFTRLNLYLMDHEDGDWKAAARHLDRAVELDVWSNRSLLWRGQYRLDRGTSDGVDQGILESALADFEAAREKVEDPFDVQEGLAAVHAWLGHAQESLMAARACIAMDRGRFEDNWKTFIDPFWKAEQWHAGIAYHRGLVETLGEHSWIQANIADLARAVGDAQLEASASKRAQQLKEAGK